MSETIEYSDLISIKNKVQFIDIKEQYDYGTDLTFRYKLEGYTPGEGDRIGIYKVGWTSVRDYQIFEWAPLKVSENIATILFKSYFVVKIKLEPGDFFQLCYLGRESEIHGVSSPFQFINEESNIRISFASGDVHIYPSHFTLERATKDYYEGQNCNFIKLKDENTMLRERNSHLEDEVDRLKTALKKAQSQNVKVDQNYDEDIASLKQTTDDLKKADELRQLEINILKEKITEMKDVFVKLSIEKKQVEKKYETLKHATKEKSAKNKIDQKPKENEDKPENIEQFEIMDLISIPPFPISNDMIK